MNMKNVREILAQMNQGMGELTESVPEAWDHFSGFMEEAEKEGALSAKTKELISIAISVYSRCEYCIVYHTYKAMKMGCTRQEILESATLAAVFGGGPSMAYASALLVATLDEFKEECR